MGLTWFVRIARRRLPVTLVSRKCQLRGGGLARISHQLSATTADRPVPASLLSVGLLGGTPIRVRCRDE